MRTESTIEESGISKGKIGGWLWVFVVTCGLAGLVQLVSVVVFPDPLNIATVVIMLILRLRAIVSLIRVAPGALRDVKILFVALFVALAIQLLWVTWEAAQGNGTSDLRSGDVSGFFYFVLWAGYFHQSKRVLATFGKNL
jgi:hypothetical protein